MNGNWVNSPGHNFNLQNLLCAYQLRSALKFEPHSSTYLVTAHMRHSKQLFYFHQSAGNNMQPHWNFTEKGDVRQNWQKRVREGEKDRFLGSINMNIFKYWMYTEILELRSIILNFTSKTKFRYYIYFKSERSFIISR